MQSWLTREVRVFSAKYCIFVEPLKLHIFESRGRIVLPVLPFCNKLGRWQINVSSYMWPIPRLLKILIHYVSPPENDSLGIRRGSQLERAEESQWTCALYIKTIPCDKNFHFSEPWWVNLHLDSNSSQLTPCLNIRALSLGGDWGWTNRLQVSFIKQFSRKFLETSNCGALTMTTTEKLNKEKIAHLLENYKCCVKILQVNNLY